MLKQFYLKPIFAVLLFSSFSYGLYSRLYDFYPPDLRCVISDKSPKEFTISNRNLNVNEVMGRACAPNTTIKIDGQVKFTGFKKTLFPEYEETKSGLVLQGTTSMNICVLPNIEILPNATLEVDDLNIILTKQNDPIIIRKGGTIKLNDSEIRFSTEQPKLKQRINKSIKLQGFSEVFYDSSIRQNLRSHLPITLGEKEGSSDFNESFMTIEDKTVNLERLQAIAITLGAKKPLKIKGHVVFTDETKREGFSINVCYPVYKIDANSGEIVFRPYEERNIIPLLQIELLPNAVLEIENLNIAITTKDDPIIFGDGSRMILKYSTMDFENTQIEPDKTKTTLYSSNYIFHIPCR